MTPLFARLTIAGVGLIGGSLGRAARDAGLVGEVVGFGRSEQNLRVARERGLVDRVTRDPAEAVAGADAIVLAAPVGTCAALAEVFRPHAQAGAILTDAGSVKATLVAALERAWADVGPVVGAHPIAGSEASGAGAAQADLFRGRRCILTPTQRTDPQALRDIRTLWEAAGCIVLTMDPMLHDKVLGAVSHLPHAAAFALINALAEVQRDTPELDLLAYSGGGLRDTTRIAASSPEMWRDIFLWNRDNLVAQIEVFERHLQQLKRLIQSGDGPAIEQELDRAKRVREQLNR